MKPLSKLALLLKLLLKVNIAITVIAVLAGLYGYIEYSHLAPGTDANETLLPSDILNMVIGFIQAILFIFLGVTFLRWIYRANKNLRLLSSESMAFTPGWSVGWYFVPIANLYKPYQAMKEIWTVAHRRVQGGGLLGWWWFLWIVSTFFDRVAMKLAMRADDVRGYTTSALAYVASDGIDVALNVVALLLVSAVAKAYDTNYIEPGATPSTGIVPVLAPPQPSDIPPSGA